MKTDQPDQPARSHPADLRPRTSDLLLLEARYRQSHSIPDLFAWSDAVGAQTARLLAELRKLWRNN